MIQIWQAEHSATAVRFDSVFAHGRRPPSAAPTLYRRLPARRKYQKALGDPVGLAELLVFYCERATGFCENVDNQDAVYLDSMLPVFEHALKAAANLTGDVQTDLLGRLDRVRSIGRQLGNGVGDEMDVLLSEFESSPYPGGVQWKKK